MLRRFMLASRYVAIPVVVCIAVAMGVTLLYGVALTVELVRRAVLGGVDAAATKALLLDVIELVDVFLVGATLYVVMIGLYELLIDPDLPSPAWLVVKSLDDLKAKVLVMVIVILGVFFLGQVVSWNGTQDLLPLGVAIALVVTALTFFLTMPGRRAAANTPPAASADCKPQDDA